MSTAVKLTALAKTDGWQGRLITYVAGITYQPFVEGQHDCALFAAGAVQAMTGQDLAARWRGTYATTAKGLAALKRAGFADHITLVAAHFAEINARDAMPGDIAVIEGPLGLALGVVQGAGVYALIDRGVGIVPVAHILRAFRVA